MKELKITILGVPVILKNNKQIIPLPARTARKMGRRFFIVPNKRWALWVREAKKQLKNLAPSEPIGELMHAKFLFYFPDNRKRDLSNCYGAVEDILQDLGFIVNDNLIRSHDGSRVFYARENPRVEITINPFTEDEDIK